MVFSISEISDDRVTIHARAEGPGGLVGDATFLIHPGETFLDASFDTLVEMGVGGHTLPKSGGADEQV